MLNGTMAVIIMQNLILNGGKGRSILIVLKVVIQIDGGRNVAAWF